MVTRREGTRRSEEKGEIKWGMGGRMRGGRARAKGGKKPLLLFHRLVISSFDFIICYPSLFVTRASENWRTKVTNNTYDDRRSGVRFRFPRCARVVIRADSTFASYGGACLAHYRDPSIRDWRVFQLRRCIITAQSSLFFLPLPFSLQDKRHPSSASDRLNERDEEARRLA